MKHSVWNCTTHFLHLQPSINFTFSTRPSTSWSGMVTKVVARATSLVKHHCCRMVAVSPDEFGKLVLNQSRQSQVKSQKPTVWDPLRWRCFGKCISDTCISKIYPNVFTTNHQWACICNPGERLKRTWSHRTMESWNQLLMRKVAMSGSWRCEGHFHKKRGPVYWKTLWSQNHQLLHHFSHPTKQPTYVTNAPSQSNLWQKIYNL